MKKPDARQWLLISECGCNPDRYGIIADEYEWIYCLDLKTGQQVRFDLSRRMPCYTTEMIERNER